MAREVVTRRTVLHHYCSTKIRFEPPTQSVTYINGGFVSFSLRSGMTSPLLLDHWTLALRPP